MSASFSAFGSRLVSNGTSLGQFGVGGVGGVGVGGVGGGAFAGPASFVKQQGQVRLGGG